MTATKVVKNVTSSCNNLPIIERVNVTELTVVSTVVLVVDDSEHVCGVIRGPGTEQVAEMARVSAVDLDASAGVIADARCLTFFNSVVRVLHAVVCAPVVDHNPAYHCQHSVQ